MKRSEVCDKLEEIANMIVSDKLKKVTDFVIARERIIEMIQNIVKKSDLNCEVKDSFIGEISAAQFMTEDNITYLAVDCIVRKSKEEQWDCDTLFIPMDYITEEQNNDKLFTGVKLLSIESEQEEMKSRVLN